MTEEMVRRASAPTSAMLPVVNEYLDVYRAAAEHQASCPEGMFLSQRGQPDFVCYGCLSRREVGYGGWREMQRRYSWAVPDDDALAAIAEYSPHGVVEIGAGGGYWAMLLRARGVDVVAYDPDPEGGTGGDMTEKGPRWHDGRRWSAVIEGDHAAASRHPDRTLLLVWPSYDESWTDQVLDLYTGDTVIYVGEGAGGCTGTERMHAILGEGGYCWHGDGGECDCDKTKARFKQVAEVDIPQWWGLHDRLHVYRRSA